MVSANKFFENLFLARKKIEKPLFSKYFRKTAKKIAQLSLFFKKLVKHAFRMFITLFRVSVLSDQYSVSKSKKEALEIFDIGDLVDFGRVWSTFLTFFLGKSGKEIFHFEKNYGIRQHVPSANRCSNNILKIIFGNHFCQKKKWG